MRLTKRWKRWICPTHGMAMLELPVALLEAPVTQEAVQCGVDGCREICNVTIDAQYEIKLVSTIDAPYETKLVSMNEVIKEKVPIEWCELDLRKQDTVKSRSDAREGDLTND